MAEPFIFINSYRIKPGMEEEYRQRFGEVADIVEAQEPKMLYFGEHIAEDGTGATTVQVHADAENMGYHMELVGEHIQEAAQYLDFASMTLQIFGSPTEAVLDQMRQLAGSGVSVTVSPAAVSFHRFDQHESIER
jgi:UDP-N-acetylmuramoylalanine-D-glutamate ligase